jgi:hypothetical protein
MFRDAKRPDHEPEPVKAVQRKVKAAPEVIEAVKVAHHPAPSVLLSKPEPSGGDDSAASPALPPPVGRTFLLLLL